MRGDVTLHYERIEGFNKDMFTDIFATDGDFYENEDYFREDTLALGYDSEAQRCSEELYNKFKDRLNGDEPHTWLEAAIGEAMTYSNGQQTFIPGHSTYSSDYDYRVIPVDEANQKYIVVWAFSGY